MVGPNYAPPQTEVPTEFVEGYSPISDEELVEWWSQFNDPMLDAIIAETIQGNYDLQIALAQVAAARAEVQIQTSYLFPTIDLNAAALRQRFSQNLFTTASNAQAFASGATT